MPSMLSKRLSKRSKWAMAIAGTLAVAIAALLLSIIHHGISARDQPTAAEALIARSLRHLATPGALRNAPNPIKASNEVMKEARAHFADHCATCHGNDGRGDTEMGKALYPKAPDMRLATTQSLSDGELFAIIKNGVRLTGMPAWGNGTPEADLDTWKLVHFIRRLPRLSDAEIEEMKSLNPTTPGELKEQQQEERFLDGEGDPETMTPDGGAQKKSPAPPSHHHHNN